MRDVAEAIAFAQEALEPSTRDTYMSHIRVYNSWASTAGLPPLGPATFHTDTWYLKYRSDTGTAAESFKSIQSGLAFAFRYLRTNPVEHQLVSDAVVSGRKKGRPSVSRQPLSRAHLLAMSAICHLQKLSAVRDFFAILLAWRAFLRASEVRALDAEDVELSSLPAPERKWWLLFKRLSRRARCTERRANEAARTRVSESATQPQDDVSTKKQHTSLHIPTTSLSRRVPARQALDLFPSPLCSPSLSLFQLCAHLFVCALLVLSPCPSGLPLLLRLSLSRKRKTSLYNSIIKFSLRAPQAPLFSVNG
jgi:integrase